ncbi:MAG: GNAT family N-acetyltransferase [Propionicimonas sp.]
MTTHIRALELGDAGQLAELVRRSRSFLEPWEPVRPDSYFTLSGQQEAIEASLQLKAAGLAEPCVILDDGVVVGRINLNNIVRGPFQSASVGYWLDRKAVGRGLATAAVGELVTLAFDVHGLHRVEAGTLPHNVASRAVLARNGFEQFGYAQRYLAIAGVWADHILFQRLAG